MNTKKLALLLLPALVLSGCFTKPEKEEKPTYEKPEHSENFSVLPTLDRYVLLSTIKSHGFMDEATFWRRPITHLQTIFPELDLTEFADITQESFLVQYANIDKEIAKNLNWIQTYKYLDRMMTLARKYSPELHDTLDLEENATIGNTQIPTPFTNLSVGAQKQIAEFSQNILRYETQKQTNLLSTLEQLQKLPQDVENLPNDERKFFLQIHSHDPIFEAILQITRQKFPHVDFSQWEDMSLAELEDVLFDATLQQ